MRLSKGAVLAKSVEHRVGWYYSVFLVARFYSPLVYVCHFLHTNGQMELMLENLNYVTTIDMLVLGSSKEFDLDQRDALLSF